MKRFSVGLIGLIVLSSTANAQMDPMTRGRMEYLHRSILLAEQNLGMAARDKDAPRALLVNALLFNLANLATERKTPSNSCLEALGGLTGLTAAVTFAVSPVVTGDLGKMSREELRFSAQMRPNQETIAKWFSDYSATYKINIVDCERSLGGEISSRTIPDRLPSN